MSKKFRYVNRFKNILVQKMRKKIAGTFFNNVYNISKEVIMWLILMSSICSKEKNLGTGHWLIMELESFSITYSLFNIEKGKQLNKSTFR